MWTIRPTVAWGHKGNSAARRYGVPLHNRLPVGEGALRAVAWGQDGALWVSFQDGFARIANPVEASDHEVLRTPNGAHLDAQVLAADGPGGRVAVATGGGHVVVSAADDPQRWSALPIREQPYKAGLMPFAGWTAGGKLAVSVHLTCDIVVLDPDTGRDVWRRTEKVARYPTLSKNGRFLLLPWADLDASAEILDAATGKTLASLENTRGRTYGAVDDLGQWAMMGRDDSTLTLWNASTGANVLTSIPKTGVQPYGLSFLPGTTIGVVSERTAVRLLDVPTGRWLAEWSLPDGGELDPSTPQGDLAVSGDGRRLAVRTTGGLLVLAVERR